MSNKPNFEILFDWPLKELNPNAKIRHWAEKYQAVKQAKADAYQLAQFQHPKIDNIQPDIILISVRLFFPPMDGKIRDVDNLGAAMKSYQDGLIEYLQNVQHEKIDDSQIIATINVLGPAAEKPHVLYYLYPHTRSFWINKVTTLVGITGIFKREQ